MKLKQVAAGFIGANCYLLSSGGHAFVVDPSCSVNAIRKVLREHALTLDAILLTHGHFDHMMSSAELSLPPSPCSMQETEDKIPVYLGAADRDFPSDGDKNAFSRFFGSVTSSQSGAPVFPNPDRLLSDGDLLYLAGEPLKVISTPGHTAGSVCFYYAGNETDPPFLLTGDTLFSDATGRTDLYGGSPTALRASLRRLSSLDQSITVYPGHGSPALLSDALSRAESDLR